MNPENLNLNSPSRAADFIQAVLQLKPQLAVFDCDGTLWAGDAGFGFFDWELTRGVVGDNIVRWARTRYTDYKSGNVDEETMCGEMATMHRGLLEADVQSAANRYFAENMAAQIFPDMRELVRRLQESKCEVWAVSSTNVWVIRAAVQHFDIPADRVLAAATEVENGRITGRLIRVPSGVGKPRAILDVVCQIPDAAFGNSRWDTEMLAMAKHAFAVNPSPDLEKTARTSGWTIYFPDSIRP